MKENNNIFHNEHLKVNPFDIPEDYFETNSLKIQERIFSSKPECFDVPENYFESNTIKLYQKVLSQNKQGTFSVPENYFENNNEKLYNNIISAQKTTDRRIIRLFKYVATAAAIAGIVIGIDYIYHLNDLNKNISNDCKTIACLTKKDILSKEQILDEEILEETVGDEIIDTHFQLQKNDNDNNNSDTNLINQLNETF